MSGELWRVGDGHRAPVSRAGLRGTGPWCRDGGLAVVFRRGHITTALWRVAEPGGQWSGPAEGPPCTVGRQPEERGVRIGGPS
jgi:hypothetical protein